MDILDIIEKYNLKSKVSVLKPNYIKIPINRVKCDENGVKMFNEIFKYCKNNIHNELKRTKSGGISVKHIRFPSYSLIVSRTTKNKKFKGVELVILTGDVSLRVQFANYPEDGASGKAGLRFYKQELLKDGINLEDYSVSYNEGLEYKENMPKPMIELLHENINKDKTFENVHHIDFHSSYPGGLVNKHPEFKNTFDRLYKVRHDYPELNKQIKLLLDAGIGYMQSKWSDYRFSNLAYDALKDNNERMTKVYNALLNTYEHKILMFNTDGIWYQGPIFHGDGEGKGIGQWENDYVNCTFRAKSKGAYEYICDGKYYAKVRGKTKYDTIKDREDWQWGDIYKDEANPIIYRWDDNEGVIIVYE